MATVSTWPVASGAGVAAFAGSDQLAGSAVPTMKATVVSGTSSRTKWGLEKRRLRVTGQF